MWASRVVAVGLFAGIIAAAEAATFTVTNTNDGGDGSLRAAVEAANANPGPDTIEFQAGVSGTITLLTPLPILIDDVTIDGPGADLVTVSGNDSHRVFEIEPVAEVTISGLTIAGGREELGGGGIRNRGTLSLSHSVVTGNTAEFFGGGIDSNGATLTITSSRISENSVTDDGGTGGGLDIQGGNVQIIDSTISGNSVGISGGGINNTLGELLLLRTTVSNNTATTFEFGAFGGGIENTGTLTLFNSTVSGNTASSRDLAFGGGIDNFGGSVILAHVTVANNSSSDGGGGVMNEDGALTVKNSLIVNNPTGGNCTNEGTFEFTALGDNLDTDGSCPGFVTATLNDLDLGALADNGGPTMTHALRAGSVAIEAVTDCTQTDGTTPVTEDQRGIERPQGTRCDIGAYERAESTGPSEVRLTPGRLDFGDQPLEQPTEPLMGLVENIGGSDLNIGALSVVGIHAGDFSISGDSCSNQTVVAGGACGFEVVFTAKAAGVRSARVRIPSDAADGPHFVDLVGTHDVIFFDGFEGD